MKLVASKDIANVKALNIKLDKKHEHFRHEGHIHAGARFTVGEGDIFKDLDSKSQETIGTLLKYGCAVLDNDENKPVIEKIDREARAAHEAHLAASKKAPTLVDILTAITEQNAQILAALAANQSKK